VIRPGPQIIDREGQMPQATGFRLTRTSRHDRKREQFDSFATGQSQIQFPGCAFCSVILGDYR
jgi:hypothetical protein